jgi:hypothetical protein
VIAVLEARQIPIPKAVRERIERSSDAAELDRWVRRAAVIHEAGQLFEKS